MIPPNSIRAAWPFRGIVVATALCAAAADANAQFAIARSAFASGGASTGGGLLLRTALGQFATGGTAGAAHRACAGFWCVIGFPVVDASPPGESDGRGAPLAFAFGTPVPNPSRPGPVRFELALPAPGRVRLDAFDVAGRRIGEPLEQAFDAGRWWLSWDGGRAGAGVYFLRLSVDGSVRGERRVVVLQ